MDFKFRIAERLRIKDMPAILVGVSLFILASCNPSQQAGKSSSRMSNSTVGKSLYSSKVLLESPIILKSTFKLGDNFIPLLSKSAQSINNELFLDANCEFNTSTINDCFWIYGTQIDNSTRLESIDGNWQLNPNTDSDFWQVNAYYHINKVSSYYLDMLGWSHSYLYDNGAGINSYSTLSNHVIPPVIPYEVENNLNYWFTSTGTTTWANSKLRVVAKSTVDGNAFFSPLDTSIELGTSSSHSDFFMAQDPSVMYHEYGHAVVKLMMNVRNIYYSRPSNVKYQTTLKSDLGSIFYDEGGAINEGVCDYFSYLLTARKHFGEWGLGVLYNASRPMTEDDPIHASGISTAIDSRLSYPHYLLYDPNYPTEGLEDIHYAGQIVSHYLVALSEELKSQCGFNHDEMARRMFLLLSQTYAEIGDITGQATDYYSSATPTSAFTNLIQNNEVKAQLWTQIVNPPNFRRFFQIFAKNLHTHITLNMCPAWSQYESEELLDSYGLLLFSKYNDRRPSSTDTNTTASSFNRIITSGIAHVVAPAFSASTSSTSIGSSFPQRTMLVDKTYIGLPAKTDSRPEAYIIDQRTAIESLITSLQLQGHPDSAPTPGLSGTNYNNNNNKPSPGEIIGLALNMINNSSSEMGGIHILANSWDHTRTGSVSLNGTTYTQYDMGGVTYPVTQPCIMGTTNPFPSKDAGGYYEVVGGVDTSTSAGGCNYTTRNNADFSSSSNSTSDFISPVCFVEALDGSQTKWITQGLYSKEILGLTKNDCLNNDNQTNFDPNQCLIRVLPGGQQAFYSKLRSQKSWIETMQAEGNTNPTFNYSGVLLLELNKKIPPGTLFNCRFRVRFTNCKQCWTNTSGNDYLDYEFAGAEPFQVINFQFRVGYDE